MSEQDKDQEDLLESRRALAEAQKSAVRTDVAVAAIQQTSAEIRSIVNQNGYITRFRSLLRGA